MITNKRLYLAVALIVLLVLIIPLLLWLVRQRITMRREAETLQQMTYKMIGSRKKGLSGPALGRWLEDVNATWYYNWAPAPIYSGPKTNAYNADLWKGFVPSFIPYSKPTSGLASYTDLWMKEICTKTNYCNGGYYIIGNEPDIKGQDFMTSCTLACPSNCAGKTGDDYKACYASCINGCPRSEAQLRESARNAAVNYGAIMKKIKQYDLQAKFIIIGLGRIDEEKIGNQFIGKIFIDEFVKHWKNYWKSDAVVASLPNLITGYHLHTYNKYYDYWVCPTDDSIPKIYLDYLKERMITYFGKSPINPELWITEMGSLDSNGHFLPSLDNVEERNKFKNRMRCLVNIYEKSPLVTRYAWFYGGCGVKDKSLVYCVQDSRHSLLVNNLDLPDYLISDLQITDLGEVYRSLATSSIAQQVTTLSNPRMACEGGIKSIIAFDGAMVNNKFNQSVVFADGTSRVRWNATASQDPWVNGADFNLMLKTTKSITAFSSVTINSKLAQWVIFTDGTSKTRWVGTLSGTRWMDGPNFNTILGTTKPIVALDSIMLGGKLIQSIVFADGTSKSRWNGTVVVDPWLNGANFNTMLGTSKSINAFSSVILNNKLVQAVVFSDGSSKRRWNGTVAGDPWEVGPNMYDMVCPMPTTEKTIRITPNISEVYRPY